MTFFVWKNLFRSRAIDLKCFALAKKSSKTEFYIDWMLHFGEGIHSSYVYFSEKILFKNKEHTLYFVYLFINERTLLWTVLVKFVVVFFWGRHMFSK